MPEKKSLFVTRPFTNANARKIIEIIKTKNFQKSLNVKRLDGRL